ncbi:hypothetical protein [Deinococcus maricopensis]|jgi:hypothetical protein|uniref:Uncharacterized protein n=1 Tax=Deinococcus maricopensis (strain DSM 21211 / LMG 22137 / NRRL B-23946 / LB-34) TaxID=709986 RepID=E8U9I0_DEIML|nr:hypothetical protein [Deinococcus maricopensis]ADV67719.1 hypothetical protein Deima_2076 [Deinococcus maricopensis DSM 21211]
MNDWVISIRGHWHGAMNDADRHFTGTVEHCTTGRFHAGEPVTVAYHPGRQPLGTDSARAQHHGRYQLTRADHDQPPLVLAAFLRADEPAGASDRPTAEPQLWGARVASEAPATPPG